MWVARFVVPYQEDILVASRAKLHKTIVMGYPLSHVQRNGRFFVLVSACLVGDSRRIREFLSDLRKDRRTIKIEMMDATFGFWLMEQPLAMRVLYDPMIIHIKPSMVTKDGDTMLEIGSWDKAKIMAVATLLKKEGGKLLSIQQEKIHDIAIVTTVPKLTAKQRRAIELAIEHGYYGYPRNIEMQQLAKLMNVSSSTYQFHLRTAEKKLIPHLYRKTS